VLHIESLISYGAKAAREKFVLTEQESTDEAAGLVSLTEAKGGDIGPSMQESFAALLVRKLNNRCQWLNESRKEGLELQRKRLNENYTEYINSRNKSSFKKR